MRKAEFPVSLHSFIGKPFAFATKKHCNIYNISACIISPTIRLNNTIAITGWSQSSDWKSMNKGGNISKLIKLDHWCLTIDQSLICGYISMATHCMVMCVRLYIPSIGVCVCVCSQLGGRIQMTTYLDMSAQMAHSQPYIDIHQLEGSNCHLLCIINVAYQQQQHWVHIHLQQVLLRSTLCRLESPGNEQNLWLY